MYHYDRSGILQCNSCGSRTFKLVTEQIISQVAKNEDDPISDRTIESENIVSIICERCGRPVNND